MRYRFLLRFGLHIGVFLENAYDVYYRLVNIDNKYTDKTPIDLNGNPIYKVYSSVAGFAPRRPIFTFASLGLDRLRLGNPLNFV